MMERNISVQLHAWEEGSPRHHRTLFSPDDMMMIIFKTLKKVDSHYIGNFLARNEIESRLECSSNMITRSTRLVSLGLAHWNEKFSRSPHFPSHPFRISLFLSSLRQGGKKLATARFTCHHRRGPELFSKGNDDWLTSSMMTSKRAVYRFLVVLSFFLPPFLLVSIWYKWQRHL